MVVIHGSGKRDTKYDVQCSKRNVLVHIGNVEQ